jgi:hypothetical protein
MAVEGLSTDGPFTQPKPCKCQDKAACNCQKEKTMASAPPKDDEKDKEKPDSGSAPDAGGGNAPPPDNNAPPPDDGNVPPDEQQKTEAPSVQVAKAVYTSLKNLQGNLDAAANTYENPEAKSYFEGPFKEKCNEAMGEIKGLISKLGSNTGDDVAEPNDSGDSESGESGDPNEDEEAMKSFLALGQTNDLKLRGYVAPLNALSKAKNLTEEQRLCLGGVLKSIHGLCDESKKNADEAKKKTLAAQVSSLQEGHAGLTKSMADLQTSLSQLLGK